MSAEVIAADLRLDLYTVNLATVVDKYVGETEKNLERIFAEAGGVNAVLFFDEADAIFGKRSDVRDAHDRYANIESAYLLQRLETFDGLAVLATNLRANIDEAFTRRLDAIIDFPAPTPELRRVAVGALPGAAAAARRRPRPRLPRRVLRAGRRQHPLGGDHGGLPGGGRGHGGAMLQVITAVEQEYRKLGRLVLEREFGHYYGPRHCLMGAPCSPVAERRQCHSGPCIGGTMHTTDGERESLRPKAVPDRRGPRRPRRAGRGRGRSDVLGADGILGLQRSAGNAGVTSLLEEERSPVHDVVRSGGRPLDPDVRTGHGGAAGPRLRRRPGARRLGGGRLGAAVNAHAYTVGSNIVFQRDSYDPVARRAGPRWPTS